MYVALSVLLGLIWVASTYPDIPATAGQWLWILALALPLQIAGEFLGERLWNNKVTRQMERKTAAKSFSLLRIAYGVIYFLFFIGLLLAAGYGWQALKAM